MSKKGGSSPPPAPDPVATANAQTASNIQTAQENQRLNMVNSYGPDGSVTYQSDPSAPGGYSQTTTLSPYQQQLYNLGNQAAVGAYGIANDQLGRVNSALSSQMSAPTLERFNQPDFNSAVNAARDNAYGYATSRLDPQWDQRQQQLETQLANQGLDRNSTAYRTAMGDFGRDRNDAYNQAWQSSYATGQDAEQQGFGQYMQGLDQRNSAAQGGWSNSIYAANQPINQLSALLSTGQVQMPGGIGYSPSHIAGTDVAGITQQNYANNLSRYNIQQQSRNSMLGGLFGLGGAVLGGKWFSG